MYCDVVVSNNSLFVENTYTYKIPSGIESTDIVGRRVTIPFGNDLKLGLIISTYEEPKTEFIEFKEFIDLVDDYPIVTIDVITILLLMSERTGNTISRYLNSIYPITFNLQRKTLYKVENIDSIDLVLRTVLPIEEFEIAGELELYRKDILKYVELGDISSKDIYKRKSDYKYSSHVRYTGRKPLRMNANQEEIVEMLENTQNQFLEVKTLVDKYGFSKSAINTLVKNQILEKMFLREKPLFKNDFQNDAQVHKIPGKSTLIRNNCRNSKLEYLKKIVAEKITEKRNILILLPDIASVPLIVSEMENDFSEKIGVYHSKISERKKFDLLNRMSNDDVKILIGVGGAAIAPLKNIGTLIVYESSDRKFLKSQYNFYDIISVAEIRSEINSADLIHISTSPSISDFYKKQNDQKWEHINLDSKILLQSSIVDMREELKKNNYQILSLELQKKILRNLSDFKTSFLLVNVKSDNSSLKCRNCGKTTVCPHCGTNLRLSDKTKILSCSSCNFEIEFQSKCIYCGSDKIRKMKLGIENVYEFVNKEFNNASVLMLTMDDLSSMSKINKIVTDIISNKYDIIIGTKDIVAILPKNQITLVALVMVDITLNINSYKASELAFNEISAAINIISHDSSNELLIQTYEPNNRIINYAINSEYEKYYNDEIIYREISNNPPFKEIIYLNTRISENRYRGILNNLQLYIRKYFSDGTYFGPHIETKNGSNMVDIIYTLKVSDITSVISFRKLLIDAFGNESLFITIEHD